MATVSTPLQAAPSYPEEQRFVLRGVDWETYRKISDALTGRHVRLTYDRGTLELMTISTLHGRFSRLIGRLIQVLTEELGMSICSCGDMTCDREDLERGLEPDEGFYLTHEPQIRDREQVDLTVDPPPDLTVEVDLHRSPRSRMAVYAGIRVPEVWRFDGQNLRIHQLGPDGQYAAVERSSYFSFVSGDDIVRFLQLRTQMDENGVVRLFREWVQEQIRAQGTSQP
jgi:Uma2 family endonuclease